MYVIVCVYMSVFTYTYICIYIYTPICIHMYTYTNIHKYNTHIYAMYMHKHASMLACVFLLTETSYPPDTPTYYVGDGDKHVMFAFTTLVANFASPICRCQYNTNSQRIGRAKQKNANKRNQITFNLTWPKMGRQALACPLSPLVQTLSRCSL